MAFKVNLCTNESPALPWDGRNKHFVMKKRVDFTQAANQLAQNEIMALFDVPAGVLVEEVLMNVVTADADVSDVDIGSFTTAEAAISADGFMDGADISSTGLKRDLAGETYSRQDQAAGYMGTSDWIVGFTNKDADTLNGAVIDFYAVCVDLR